MKEIKFSSEQYSLIKNNKVGNFKITGPAGSGKSLILVERALYLLTESPYKEKGDNVLITFYNKSLKKTFYDLLSKNPLYEKVKNRIKIVNIDNYIYNLLNQQNEMFPNKLCY